MWMFFCPHAKGRTPWVGCTALLLIPANPHKRVPKAALMAFQLRNLYMLRPFFNFHQCLSCNVCPISCRIRTRSVWPMSDSSLILRMLAPTLVPFIIFYHIHSPSPYACFHSINSLHEPISVHFTLHIMEILCYNGTKTSPSFKRIQ